MDLTPMFNMQRELFDLILKTKGLPEGVDTWDDDVLAFQVEVGELANEWRGFKYWSNHPRPTERILDEYVDVLKMAIQLALDVNVTKVLTDRFVFDVKVDESLDPLVPTGYILSEFMGRGFKLLSGMTAVSRVYEVQRLILDVLGIRHRFGFKEEQVVNAFRVKHEVNMHRQNTGY